MSAINFRDGVEEMMRNKYLYLNVIPCKYLVTFSQRDM